MPTVVLSWSARVTNTGIGEVDLQTCEKKGALLSSVTLTHTHTHTLSLSLSLSLTLTLSLTGVGAACFEKVDDAMYTLCNNLKDYKINIRIYIYIHTYTYIYIHTYIYSHIYLSMYLFRPLGSHS